MSYAYSCLTCHLAFQSSQAQREHMSSDLHKFNSKRKVANLPPVTAEVFNEKVVERRRQIEEATAAKEVRLKCGACNKTFSSENVYNDHLKSKRHRERVVQGLKDIKVDQLLAKKTANVTIDDSDEGGPSSRTQQEHSGTSSDGDASMPSAADDAAASSATSSTPVMAVLTEKSCLFCPRSFASLEVNLKHMAHNHSFYIPDEQYCVDVPGLLAHLAQDISLGNICIFCGHGFGGSVTGSETDAELVKRARRGMEAVRKHMVDKVHCRIPWDTEDQRLELSDYYDYRSSYPEGAGGDDSDLESEEDEDEAMDEDGEWEDEEGGEIDENDEVVMDYSAVRRRKKSKRTVKAMDDDLEARLAYGESDYELVLPSGNRIGHRALKSVYRQNVMPYIDLSEPVDKVSRLAAALEAKEARKQADSSALIPSRGGLPMVVARNAGEAKEARKAQREFREVRKFNDHFTRVAKVHNHQKHFRDHLLQ